MSMYSVSAFDLVTEIERGSEPIRETQHFEDTKIVSGTQEKLDTYIFVNETTPSGYRNYRIISDEVIDFRARVLGQHIDQVIKQGLYEVFYHPIKNRLVALCKKDEAYKVSNIFENRFNLEFNKHEFNIPEIIAQSSDVRGARFNVQIETVRGVSLRGSNVHTTQYYANMIAAGELTGVTVTYDYQDRTVTFRVSTDGTLLFYTPLTDHEYLDFVDMLYTF